MADDAGGRKDVPAGPGIGAAPAQGKPLLQKGAAGAVPVVAAKPDAVPVVAAKPDAVPVVAAKPDAVPVAEANPNPAPVAPPQPHPGGGDAPPPAPAGGNGPRLRLSATVSPKPAVLAPNGVTIASGGSVRFGVTATDPVSAPTLVTATGDSVPATFTNADGSATAAQWTTDVTFSTAQPDGVFARASRNGVDLESEKIRIQFAASQPPAEEEGVTAPAEVKVGEYDPKFAEKTGATFKALAFVIAGLTAWMLLWIMPVGGGQDGTPFGQRILAAASIVTLAVGALSVLAGVWLATLEARGRQRAKLPLQEAGSTRGGIASDIPFDEVVKLAKELGKARGTVIAFVIGVLLIIVGLLGVSGGALNDLTNMGDDGSGSTSQTTNGDKGSDDEGP